MRNTMSALELQDACKPILATQAHEMTTAKYRFVSSYKLNEWLNKLGWYAVQVQVKHARSLSRRLTTKHSIFYTRPEYARLEEFPAVIVVNAHDGTSSVQFYLAMIRYVCSNGLVAGTSLFQPIRIRHTGFCWDRVKTAMQQVENAIPRVLDTVAKMQSVQLSHTQVMDFAALASRVRFDFSPPKAKTFSIDNLERARRVDDMKQDLWTVFNRIQENTTQGGKGMGFRRLTSIDKNIKVNRALWDLAVSYLPQQNAA